MTLKECLYHITRVQDLYSEITIVDSVHVVSEFAEVFPNDLLVHPLEREIHFGIELLPETNPISIPLYRCLLPMS